jgi:hypothetical protein
MQKLAALSNETIKKYSVNYDFWHRSLEINLNANLGENLELLARSLSNSVVNDEGWFVACSSPILHQKLLSYYKLQSYGMNNY